MSETVFWSWQADLNPKVNRSFIRAALDAARGKAQEELQLEEPERTIALDHDTKSAQGMADIVGTIFEQVAKAAIFVADVTPVTTSEAGKAVPNPNVMIELGYAMRALGPERIIAVLNVGCGSGPEALPFDIRQRRILTYNLPPEADSAARAKARSKLTDDLATALVANLQAIERIETEHTEIEMAEEDRHRPGVWKGHWPAIHRAAFGQEKSVLPKLVPRAVLRVAPAEWPSGIPPIAMLDGLSAEATLYAPYGTGTSGDHGPFQDGYLAYWMPPESSNGSEISVFNVAAFLESPGEVWLSDGAIVEKRGGKTFVSHSHLMMNWIRGLDRSHALLDELGAGQRRRVLLEVSDLSGTYWSTQQGYVPSKNRKTRVAYDRTEAKWEPAVRKDTLRQAWNALRNAYSEPPMSADNFDQYYRARAGSA
ncbi:hypothetical protein [Leisingera methylohalidivorans]|uniref:CD-NTase-associated protein 12/Pycsar effector protein TIR domain-containing protein n=1 Tax=Leisingera methylohalidivorans DSM 14336 TaxID=999552 RepID=V9VYD6_9RHOB|nr:hypothetical protein [Leisingera methylohalidivorans]AHD02958.1 hypothetical protein METH_06945 [Leisingera methylohalidivorans DSM 14336]